MRIDRIVVDTNILLENLLSSTGPSAAIINKCSQLEIELLFSIETYSELQSVIERPKFDRYVSKDQRIAYANALLPTEFILISNVPMGSRDPSDDKFLETAVNGRADVLITRDDDLLSIREVNGIPIYTPMEGLLIFDD